MKLLIAGLATGLFIAATPVWADSWKYESGHGWRGTQWQARGAHREHRSEQRERHWERHHRHFNHHHHYWAPPVRRHHYYYRDYYSYRYPAPEPYVAAPSLYFSWSNSYD